MLLTHSPRTADINTLTWSTAFWWWTNLKSYLAFKAKSFKSVVSCNVQR